MSLGKFKNVQFLLSNQYYDDDFNLLTKSEIIKSSKYKRGIQIQKAKQLIVSGFPGAALKVLEDINLENETALSKLTNLVDFFNLHSQNTDSKQDFEIAEASQRIVNALDLIAIFFTNQNYIQGISLLAAAQETFMKIAVLSKIAKISDTININNKTHKISDLIEWQPLGLFLISNLTCEIKKQVLQKLKFPEYILNEIKTDKNFKFTNSNHTLLAWLKRLEPNFKSWSLLEWSCKQKRNSDEDLRNQFLHNLRGMETQDVIQYLSAGDTSKSINTNVMDIYNTGVKQPFFTALELFELAYKREKVNKILQEIADSII